MILNVADTALLVSLIVKSASLFYIFEQFIGFPQEVSHGEWDSPLPPLPDNLAEEKPGEGSGFKMDYTDIRSIYIRAREGYSAARVGCQVMGYVRARYKRAEPKYE